jgi:hypothetical protein
MTKASKPIAPPPPRSVRAGFLGTAAAPPLQAADNMKATTLKDMTFKVENDWHKWFKGLSADAEMSMKDIFKEAVDDWAVRRFGEEILNNHPSRFRHKAK